MNNRCVTLGSCLRQYRNEIWVDDAKSYGQITVSSTGTISHRGTKSGGAIGRKRQFAVDLETHPNTLIFTRQGIYDGAIGFAPPETDGCIATENMPLFSLKPGISREYFEQLLFSPVFKSEVKKLAPKGAAQKSIHERELLDVSIPIPSLESQIAIAEAVAKERQIVGSLQNEITHQQSLLTKLKQAILQEAIQGKLTADWRAANPETEPASELLKRILTEKAKLIAAKKLKKEKPLPPIKPEEIPFEIPEGWEWCRLGELCRKVTDGFHNTPPKADKGFPYIAATHVKSDGIDWANAYFVEEKNHRELYSKTKPQKGDILVVNIGAGSGCPAIIDVDFEFSFKNTAILKFNKELLSNRHIFNYLVHIQKENYARLTRGANQPFLSLKVIKEFLFPLPPLAEQAAIVERVEELMATCRELETEIENSRTHTSQLLQAILKEAFAPAS